MSHERFASRVRLALLQLLVVVMGLVVIVGSGGGGSAGLGIPDAPQCFNSPQGCIPPPALQPNAFMTPQRPIVQVGTPVNFEVSSDVTAPTYHWCRKAKGENTCFEIAGVSGPTYTLAAASLADDGAVFQVTVSGSNGQVIAGSFVGVSSQAPVTITDAEFVESNWSHVVVADPPLAVQRATVSRVASGGNPGAYRLLTVDLPLELRTVNLVELTAAAVYDPATQGDIYLIEFSLDCNNIAVTFAPTFTQTWQPTLEQGGRRFVSIGVATCFSPGWHTTSWSGFDSTAFKLVDGPACGVAEACPDFSSQGQPLRLGMSYNVALRSPLPVDGSASAPHYEQGFDNFKANVWRH
jgi:hypothetical protein